MTDDITFKRDFMTVNGSLPQVLRFVLSHTGMNAGLAERFRALVHIFQNGGQIAQELMETRCDRGAEIARKMRFLGGCRRRLFAASTNTGMAAACRLGLGGDGIPIYSRIALLAQVVDVFQIANGIDAAKLEIATPDRNLVRSAIGGGVRANRAERAEFWADAALGRSADRRSSRLSRRSSSSIVDDDYLDDIAAAFAQVIDSKSPYTSGHSERVTLFTDLIAEATGVFAGAQRRWLKRAALLHDIGKLGVSNSDPRQAGQTRSRRMGGDAEVCRARRNDPGADHCFCRPRCHRGRASRTARWQRISARPQRRSDFT